MKTENKNVLYVPLFYWHSTSGIGNKQYNFKEGFKMWYLWTKITYFDLNSFPKHVMIRFVGKHLKLHSAVTSWDRRIVQIVSSNTFQWLLHIGLTKIDIAKKRTQTGQISTHKHTECASTSGNKLQLCLTSNKGTPPLCFKVTLSLQQYNPWPSFTWIKNCKLFILLLFKITAICLWV